MDPGVLQETDSYLSSRNYPRSRIDVRINQFFIWMQQTNSFGMPRIRGISVSSFLFFAAAGFMAPGCPYCESSSCGALEQNASYETVLQPVFLLSSGIKNHFFMIAIFIKSFA